MDLATVFKLSLYGLTAVVGVILGAAEGEGAMIGKSRTELFLPYLSLPVVICGYLFTEGRWKGPWKNGMGLTALWANLLGIVALMATAHEFNSENREGKLLAGTHLLLYATWIVLFQHKTIRSYWFLMALGILQLAIASVLTRSEWFGFCAVGYMFGAVWTLSIFSLWRAEQLFAEESLHRTTFPMAPNGNAVLLNGSERRYSEVRGAVQHEEGTQWLTARFVSGVLMTTFSALVVSTAFFAFIPRVWVGPEFSYQDELDQIAGVGRKTGFATTVKLGDLAPVLESAERVFEIQISERGSGSNPNSDASVWQSKSVQYYAEQLGLAEPLFRGAVLTKYERGRWSFDGESEYQQERFGYVRSRVDVRQEVRLENSASSILYCLGKPVQLRDSKGIRFGNYNDSTGVLSRGDGGATEYTVYSTIPEHHQSNFKLHVSSGTVQKYNDERERYLDDKCREFPPSLIRVKALARDIVGKETRRRNALEGRSTPRDLTNFEIAETLEFYLRESGEYRYSLDMSVQDARIDPVEDFIFNRKAGHCEYFASALALMLRSVKIPARIVSGYKGGIEHPERRNYSFEVQQRFSHMWVEAWFDHDGPGGWVTFDATPIEARMSSVADFAAKRPSMWSGMQTTLSGLWSENVLKMSLDRQEQSIYKPMRELAYDLLLFMQQLFTSPRMAFRTLWDLVMNREQWFSVGGGLLAFVILLVLSAVIWLARRGIWQVYLWMTTHVGSHNQRRRRVVDFYERFSKLAQTHGLEREPWQTQQEFAAKVSDACQSLLSKNGSVDAPATISQSFYRVRFGDHELSANDMDQLERSLLRLERAMANGAATR